MQQLNKPFVSPPNPQSDPNSSLHALTSGSLARTVCLTNESHDDFQRLVTSQLGALQPTNEIEVQLVEEMVVAKWTQRRYWGIQTATLVTEMADQAPAFERKYEKAPETVRQAAALQGLNAKTNTMGMLKQWDTSMHRQYHRALQQLFKIRVKNLFPTEPPPAPAPSKFSKLRNEPETEPKTTVPSPSPAPKTNDEPLKMTNKPDKEVPNRPAPVS